jgi:hypothetical protein
MPKDTHIRKNKMAQFFPDSYRASPNPAPPHRDPRNPTTNRMEQITADINTIITISYFYL